MLNPRFDPTLLSRVEDAGLNASAPPQQRWLDGWLLRFSPGKAKRARCINAVARGRLPLNDKLALCEQAFAEAGLPLIVRITPLTEPDDLDAVLADIGLHRFDDTRVMVAATLPAAPPPPLNERTTLHAIGLEQFAQRVGALRGSPLAQRQAHAQRLVNAPVPFFALELRVDGDLVCCGQFALELDLVGLYDIYTAADARGRGHARLLCQHLLAQAQARGARHAYLQVDAANEAARSIYRQLGFDDAYPYHYCARNPGTT